MESQKSTSVTSNKSPPTITRDDEYYFRDGNLVILVEDRLLKIHQSLFERDSPVFQTLFSLPQDTSPNEDGSTDIEGSSDDNPVIFQDRLADFRALCWAVYSRPTDLTAQHPIEVSKLVSLVAITQKYEFLELCDWALSILSKHSEKFRGQFINSCGGWGNIRRIFILAQQCGYTPLAQRIEEEWLHLISGGSPLGGSLNAFKQALAVAEGSAELRKFHGKAYYAYLRATGVFEGPAFTDVGTIILGSRPYPYDVGRLLSNLSDKQKLHMYQGLWSLSRLRVRLARAPRVPDEISCGPNHANVCIVAWQARWEAMLDAAKQAGTHLNDPGKLLDVFLKSLATHPVRSLAEKSKLPPIPCSNNLKLLLKFTKENVEDGIAGYFMID